jgi:hypothetical protein
MQRDLSIKLRKKKSPSAMHKLLSVNDLRQNDPEGVASM